MKYTCEIVIERPLKAVTALFTDPEEAKNWQPGLISMQPVSGEPGKEGAVSILKFRMGKRTVEMKETITVNRLPAEFHGRYEAQGVYNIVRNYFTEEAPGRTRYVCENEFRFSGFLMTLMGALLPGSFRKQSMEYLTRFKQLCESK
jgi:hypothetical protein